MERSHGVRAPMPTRLTRTEGAQGALAPAAAAPPWSLMGIDAAGAHGEVRNPRGGGELVQRTLEPSEPL